MPPNVEPAVGHARAPRVRIEAEDIRTQGEAAEATTDMTHTVNDIDIFLPAASDPEEAARQREFLDSVSGLMQDGLTLHIYVQGRDDWAFTQCEPVADILDIFGPQALPITLAGPTIMGMYSYPSVEKILRLAHAPRADGPTPAASRRDASPRHHGTDA